MLSPFQMYDYQKQAALHQMVNDKSMLWLGVGLGKTVVTLTSTVDRMRAGLVQKTLIFGPLRVIEAVWEREAKKWSHTEHLRCITLTGTPATRRRKLFKEADIYLCNYENMNWLAETLQQYYLDQGLPIPFQSVVYDEVTKLKNSQSVRFKGGSREKINKRTKQVTKERVIGWKKIAPHFTYRTGLTGSPASNGYIDLFGQYYAIDDGERLGTTLTRYRSSYFASDYMGWSYTVTEPGRQWIEHKIADITLKMDSRDYLDLPAVRETNIMVDLPAKARKHYDEVEAKMFTELDTGKELEVFSKSSVGNKCLQICNGNPYTDLDGEWENLHDAKLDALEDVLEEAGGQPVLLAYAFKSDAQRIMKRLKKYKPVNLTGEKSSRTSEIIKDWNSGKIKLLIGHPASMGHGLDGLQDSCSILVWFGLNWSLELYIQFNGRIDRNGQKNPVSLIRILCRDTLDMAVADAIMRKATDEDGLKNSISRYREGGASAELTFL